MSALVLVGGDAGGHGAHVDVDWGADVDVKAQSGSARRCAVEVWFDPGLGVSVAPSAM